MLISTWKVNIEDRSRRLQTELDNIRAKTPEAANDPHFTSAARAVNYARSLAGLAPIDYLPTDSVTGYAWWQRPVARLTGASIEAAWLACHRADEALLLVQPADTVRSRAVEMLADVSSALPSSDPRVAAYKAILEPVAIGELAVPAFGAAVGTQGNQVPSGDVRPAMQSIRATLNASSDNAHGNLRSFRNVLAAVMFVLLLGCIAIAFVGQFDQSAWSVCGPSETAGSTAQQCLDGGANPRGLDLAEVAIAAALGGLVSAAVGLLKQQGFQGPYSLPLVQALMKIPMGAAVGLAAILLLQRNLLGLLGPVPGTRVLAYAVLFGFAQLAVTTLIDTRANDVIQKARSKDDPNKSTSKATPSGVSQPAATH